MSPVTDAVTPVGGQVVLLLNSRSRNGRRAEAAVAEALAAQRLDLARVVRISNPRRLGQAIQDLAGRDVGRLIVGGGDGTLSTVAAQLALRRVDLAVIPLGTANDFARTLGIPARLADAAAIAAGSHVREIDLGRANDAFFLNVASVGMSVSALRRLSHPLKRRLGPTAYLVAGALAFVRHPTFHARIDSPAGSSESMVHQVVVGNGRFFGGGVLVARASTLEDGSLTVYTLGRRGRWGLLSTIAMLRFQVPLDHPGDDFLQTPSAVLQTAPSGKPVNLDGEIRTTTPVTFTVVPRALRVLTSG